MHISVDYNSNFSGNSGTNNEQSNCPSALKKLNTPFSSHTQTSFAPDSKYNCLFSVISFLVLLLEITSMQISGAIEASSSFLIFAHKSAETQATSATFVPLLVLIAHPGNVLPCFNNDRNRNSISPYKTEW
jgi:hypothetical protein